MSLPLRFKAVHKPTGEVVTRDFYDLYSVGLLTEMRPDGKEFEICQSTGLTDSQGKEVFFGDVLCDAFGNMHTVEYKYGAVCYEVGSLYFPVYDSKVKLYAIGNKWEPIETLKQRAGDVNG